MSDYYIRSPNDYLEHSMADSVKAAISAALSGRTKSGHKYYKRISLGKDKKGKNKYQYFYSAEEYQKYLKNQNEKESKSILFRPETNNDLIGLLASTPLRLIGGNLIGDIGAKVISELIGSRNRDPYSDDISDNDDDNVDDNSTPEEKSASKRWIYDHPPNKPKYIAKVKTDNGKWRYFYKQSEYEAYLQKHQPDKLEDFNKLENHSFDDVNKHIGEINPHYTDGDNYQTNCADCALAYEMRRRGYDVMADDSDDDYDEWGSNFGLGDMFKGGKMDYYKLADCDSSKDAADKLSEDMKKKYPEGARGFVNIDWANGDGHRIAWEIHDGDVYYIDPQINKTMKNGEFSAYMENINYEHEGYLYGSTKKEQVKLNIGNILGMLNKKGYSSDISTYRVDNLKPSDKLTKQLSNNSANQNIDHKLEKEASENDPQNYKKPNPHYKDSKAWDGELGKEYIDANGDEWSMTTYTEDQDSTTRYWWRKHGGDGRYHDIYDPSGYGWSNS